MAGSDFVGMQIELGKSELKEIKVVHKEMKYPCDQCEYSTSKLSNIKRHKISMHDLTKPARRSKFTSPNQPIKKAKRIYRKEVSCETCERTFYNSQSLKRHIPACSNKKELQYLYSCLSCQAYFSCMKEVKGSECKEHIIHVQCKLCSKVFSQPRVFRMHFSSNHMPKTVFVAIEGQIEAKCEEKGPLEAVGTLVKEEIIDDEADINDEHLDEYFNIEPKVEIIEDYIEESSKHSPKQPSSSTKTKRQYKKVCCATCDKTFYNKQGLQKHQSSKGCSAKKVLQYLYCCLQCKTSFPNMKEVKSSDCQGHKIQVQCKICKKVFSQPRVFHYHFNSSHCHKSVYVAVGLAELQKQDSTEKSMKHDPLEDEGTSVKEGIEDETLYMKGDQLNEYCNKEPKFEIDE